MKITEDARTVIRFGLLIIGAALLLWFVIWSMTRPPRPDPHLGRSMKTETAAKAAETQAVTEKAIPVMRERIQAPIRKHTEKARHYAAKIEAAPPPAAGAVHVPDDDAYRGLCQPGGVYQGHKERGRECRKLKG